MVDGGGPFLEPHASIDGAHTPANLNATDLVRVHATVSGRVQGVGFRFSTVDRARQLGVRGWVRNLPDGSVEAEAEGERAAVEALVRFLHRGPTYAQVDDVALRWDPYGGELGEFSARH